MLSPIEEFTRALLVHRGALVERDRAGLAAMMPAPLAEELGVDEYVRLVFDPRAEANGALRVDYDSPLVDRFGRVVEHLGRVGSMRVPPIPLKDLGAEEAVGRGLVVANGVVRNYRVAPAGALYVCFFIEYELLADERVSGLLELWINATMRSWPRLHGLLGGATELPLAAPADLIAARADAEGTLRQVRDAWSLVAPTAEGLVRQRLDDAIESLRRRRDRDVARLRDYYAGIDQDLRRRARRALAKNDEESVRTEIGRLEATVHAYRSRVADLVDRYGVQVRLAPLAAITCTLPVHRVTVRLHRRLASRDVDLAWNPIDNGIERPCCEGCGRGLSTITLCDERVHALCERCTAPCQGCGKSFCRACHPACPRRHAR